MSRELGVTPRRRGLCHEDPGETRIPRPAPLTPLRRATSMRASPAARRRFPVIVEAPDGHAARSDIDHVNLLDPSLPPSDDDDNSLCSFPGSVMSAMSCDHAFIARNGTTFSGRRNRYVVHCSSHAGETDEYLTPTQRATRQIRRLRAQLKQARDELDEKNRDIFRLTKEVVELRLASDPAPDDKCEEPKEDVAEKHNCSDVQSSLADSGHFEDIASMSVHSRDSHHSPMYRPARLEKEDREGERRRIVLMFEKKMEEMQRNHVDECQEMKEKHNDKVESLLSRLSEANDRCSSLRAESEAAAERARRSEVEAEALRRELAEQEGRHQEMYLKMYAKGQEAARFEHADQVLEFAHQAPGRVSVPELLKQLQVTQNELESIKDPTYQQPDKSKTLLSAKEAVSLYLLGTRKAMYRRIVEAQAGQRSLDPEVTLQFLKSAVFYFFTDHENQHGHLNAMQSILGYTDSEKRGIEKGYRAHFK